MSLPFERPSRSHSAGFTLLEAMLTFIILGVVLAATYSTSARSMRHQTEARQDYELTTMARAVLDEYVLTYPAMPLSGTFKGTWDWRVMEAPQDVLKPTDHDYYFEFVRVTVVVKKKTTSRAPLELSTVIARRAPGI